MCINSSQNKPVFTGLSKHLHCRFDNEWRWRGRPLRWLTTLPALPATAPFISQSFKQILRQPGFFMPRGNSALGTFRQNRTGMIIWWGPCLEIASTSSRTRIRRCSTPLSRRSYCLPMSWWASKEPTSCYRWNLWAVASLWTSYRHSGDMSLRSGDEYVVLVSFLPSSSQRATRIAGRGSPGVAVTVGG